MTRIPRCQLVDVGAVLHCTFRINNMMGVFKRDDIAKKFLELLAKYKQRHGILIYSYCLMPTHAHVVVATPQGQEAFSAFWHDVNGPFATYVNKRLGRKGNVVMERLRSPSIQPDGRHLLTVMLYGDLNPVKAGLTDNPENWKYSSFRFYALGERNDLIDVAPDYLALGHSPAARRKAYLQLFSGALIKPLLKKRPDFTLSHCIGDEAWMTKRAVDFGLLSEEPPN